MPRGSYIKNLQAFNQGRKLLIKKVHNDINDLRIYLLSDKFNNDTTVQVQDVLRRLGEIEQHMAEEEYQSCDMEGD